MSSSRSWYFVISFLLVRCRSESVTLEGKDVNNFVRSERKCEGLSSPMGRSYISGSAQLFRRFSQHTDADLLGFLIGSIIGLLILAVLILFVCMRVRRHHILDTEQQVVSLDSKTSPATSSVPKSNRSSWAVRLHFARRKLQVSIATENSPKAPLYETQGIEASLQLPGIPPLRKPAPVLSMKELNAPVLLPVEGGILSVTHLDLVTLSDAETPSTRSNWRKARTHPVRSVQSPDSISIETAVAQTIIANGNKRKPRHGSAPGGSPSRKGSLLSGPPLTVHPQQLISPTEEHFVDDSAHSAHEHSSQFSGEGKHE